MRTLSLALVAVATIGCRGTRSEDPPVHLNWNMDFQERGDPQEFNGFFADGRVMRKPPEGTVAVGFLKDDDHLYQGRNLDGTLADALPPSIKLDEKLLGRGEARFNIYCAPCHGQTGHGDGPATRRGGGFAVAPANLHLARLRPEALGYFFHVVTHGKGKMRSYKAQIPVEDRWAIAAWVRTLQRSHDAKQSDMPPAAAAPAQGGAPAPARGDAKDAQKGATP
ncbi:MAG TPA: cytochrome c [Nannocystaceae bacterium]|nr:cytochrome c [Nannocystaceae bacterium]